MTQTELLPRATAAEARELTDQIYTTVENTWPLVQQMYRSHAWKALQYLELEDYCRIEFKGRRKLPRDERKKLVTAAKNYGLPTPVVAAIAGISKRTVTNDLVKPAPVEEQPKPRRRSRVSGPRMQLGAQFQTTATQLDRAIAKLERLHTDDRFNTNRSAIKEQCGPVLRRAVAVLDELLTSLG